MTDLRRVLIGRAMAVVTFLAAVVGIVWALAIGDTSYLWSDWVIHNAIVAVGSAAIAWVVIPSQPRNALIWVFAWAGLFTGLLVFVYAVLLQMLTGLGIATPVFELVPADLPTTEALLLMSGNWLWMPLFLVFTLGLALFPDGKPPTPRWSWLPSLVLVCVGLAIVGLAWEARPWGIYPIAETQDTNGGFRSLTAAMVTIGYVGTSLLIPFCLAALLVRFRRSTGVERQQFRWVVWGAAVAGLLVVAAFLFDEIGDRTELSLVLGAMAMATILASFGVAIGKYRLYDVDVVISRTFVYVSLGVFITGVYVGIVVGLGFLIGAHDGPNPWLGIVATVVIAIAFQPLRRRLQRVANRLVYGRRATPYEVLSSFSQRVSAVDPEVLTQMARSLAEGTTAHNASIWARRGGRLHCMASWPEGPSPESVADGGRIRGADRVETVLHDGEALGVVAVALQPGQPFPPTDARLLAQVAAGLGLALRNLRLTADLRERVEALRDSRRRIVEVQDATRRRLERDLHDGAQQRLVALKIKLGIGASMAQSERLSDVHDVMEALRQEADQTIDSVREFARGIYPPLLEAEGLGAALTAHGRKLSVPVTVQAAGIGRYAQEQEAATYFCLLEALHNASRHASATSIVVRLEETGPELMFEVRDDGVGFDAAARARGQGLVNMSDRLEALGGQLTITSSPDHGTLVSGRIPLAANVGVS